MPEPRSSTLPWELGILREKLIRQLYNGAFGPELSMAEIALLFSVGISRQRVHKLLTKPNKLIT